jgi:hypothetical protein
MVAAKNFKHAAFVGSIEGGGFVGQMSELCFGAKSGFLPWAWGMFWLCGRWMLESV